MPVGISAWNVGDTTQTRVAPASSNPFAFRTATAPPPTMTISRSDTSSIRGYACGTSPSSYWRRGGRSIRAGAGEQEHLRRVRQRNSCEVRLGGEPVHHRAEVHGRLGLNDHVRDAVLVEQPPHARGVERAATPRKDTVGEASAGSEQRIVAHVARAGEEDRRAVVDVRQRLEERFFESDWREFALKVRPRAAGVSKGGGK